MKILRFAVQAIIVAVLFKCFFGRHSRSARFEGDTANREEHFKLALDIHHSDEGVGVDMKWKDQGFQQEIVPPQEYRPQSQDYRQPPSEEPTTQDIGAKYRQGDRRAVRREVY